MKAFRTDRCVFKTSELLTLRENQLLTISPKFQRRDVWKGPAKSYFIDTMLRGMPVPPIYLRALLPQRGQTKVVHEVVDGQQRLRTIFDFIDGKFRLSRNLEAPWKGRGYTDLAEKDQQQLIMFAFPSEVFEAISDEDVLRVFARLNTYSVQLNQQELRNGKFFGEFMQTVSRLANEHYKFWETNDVFSPQQIARMLEVQFTSELLIAGHEGMQDKKKSLDTYYRAWDEAYPNGSRDADRFKNVIDEISATFVGGISDSQFRRPPFFYTLYCVVYHHLFGLPDVTTPSPKRGLSAQRRAQLLDGTCVLSDVISEKGPVPKQHVAFVRACASQTDNIKPRKTRFEHLWTTAFD